MTKPDVYFWLSLAAIGSMFLGVPPLTALVGAGVLIFLSLKGYAK